MPLGSSLSNFIEEASDRLASTENRLERARAVREALLRYISQPDFVLDCVDGWLENATALAHKPAIYRGKLYDTDTLFCLFSWPSGYYNQPHGHINWTVTAVVYGNLRFTTYGVRSGDTLEPLQAEDWGEGRAEIDPMKRFDSDAGQVGYIGDDCIHNVANVSPAPAISLHVFTLADDPAAPPEVRFEALPKPPVYDRREHMLLALAHMLRARGHHSPRSTAQLERIIAIGSLKAKLSAVQALSAFDRAAAQAHLSDIAAQAPEAFERAMQTLRAGATSAAQPKR